jgi:hypothetical protein
MSNNNKPIIYCGLTLTKEFDDYCKRFLVKQRPNITTTHKPTLESEMLGLMHELKTDACKQKVDDLLEMKRLYNSLI